MALAPYDAGALGQSAAAAMDKLADLNQATESRARSDKNLALYGSNTLFNRSTLPQLKSSIGATGQYDSGARHNAIKDLNLQHDLANNDITSAFHRTMTDLQRQQVYASMGLIIG